MAEMTIKLVEGPDGMRVELDLVSDRDTLQHEHEIDHKALAASLLGMTLAELQALGIEVTRKTRQAEREQGPAPAAGQRGKLQTRGNPGGGVEAFQRDYAAALLRGYERYREASPAGGREALILSPAATAAARRDAATFYGNNESRIGRRPDIVAEAFADFRAALAEDPFDRLLKVGYSRSDVAALNHAAGEYPPVILRRDPRRPGLIDHEAGRRSAHGRDRSWAVEKDGANYAPVGSSTGKAFGAFLTRRGAEIAARQLEDELAYHAGKHPAARVDVSRHRGSRWASG